MTFALINPKRKIAADSQIGFKDEMEIKNVNLRICGKNYLRE